MEVESVKAPLEVVSTGRVDNDSMAGLLPTEATVSSYLTALEEMDPESALSNLSLSANANSIASAMLEVADSVADDDDARRKLVDDGVVEQILGVLLRHPKSEHIIDASLSLLAVVLQHRPDLHGRLAAVKGPQLIIRSMINTRGCKTVQVSGCALLLELTTTQQNREIMGQFFAVEVVLSALKAFGDDLPLVTTACAFLANIAFKCSANKALIVQSGGLKSILRVMKRNKDDEAVNIWCALALRNLSVESPANQKRLTEGGCVRVLLGCILVLKDCGKLVDHALAVLYNLLDGEDGHNVESAKQTLDLRGVEIIVRCMRTFRNVASLQHSAVGCLRSLSDNGDAFSEMVLGGGGLEAVLTSMIAYRAMEAVQANGIRLIVLIGGLGKPAKMKIIQAGGLNTISLSLKTHIGNEKMVESGVAALNMLRALSRSI